MTKTALPIPNLALNLSFDGIDLMRRTETSWSVIKNVSLSSDNLPQAITALRDTMKDTEQQDGSVQLFIPLEQIKFLNFDHDPAWDHIELLEKIVGELDGKTPYSIQELRYDFCISGDVVYVAATAIQTLIEAEEFATSHHFIPLGITAQPDTATYPDYPYFGLAENPAGSMQPVSRLAPGTPPASQAPSANTPAPIIFSTKRLLDADNHRDAGKPDTAATLIAQAPSDMLQDPVVSDDTPQEPKGAVALFFSRRQAKPKQDRPFDFAAPLTLPNHRAPSADLRNDAERLTVFGKRNGQVVQDKPFGAPSALIAALIALIIFVGGAFGYYMSSGPDADTDIVVLPPEPLSSATNKPDTPVAISLPPKDVVVPDAPDSDLDTAELEPEPETPDDINTGVIYTPQELQRIYAAIGVWPTEPDAPVAQTPLPLGNVYIASIDPNVAIQDAIALDANASLTGESFQPNTRPPAPAGTIFELDGQGLVKATPEGAMAPDGHLVYLGKPSLVPPVRPEQEKADEPVIETAKLLLASSGTPLINLRPRSRPDATIATDQAQAENDALRLLRPREKPVSLEDSIQETLASLEQDSADTGLNEVLKPKARPKNLDTARKTAVITPEEEGDEAAPPTNAAPKIPSNAKVSKEATIKNALKLNKLNLLGVYGTGSKKRALVRFSNGRRQMVSVGDKLDGGKVAAIGDTELRYVKSGQNVVLKLPKG